MAGPVTAAAVIFKEKEGPAYSDSKTLSEKKRTELAEQLFMRAHWALGWVWPEEIDKINIHQASLLAMKRAYLKLNLKADKILVDGKFPPAIEGENVEAIIKGDSLIAEISAASILAKVSRDRWMIHASHLFPAYLFEQHKGYPTRLHREIIKEWGACPLHRKSFKLY